MDMGNPDFVKYAESYGAKGHRPTSADDFDRILQHCIDTHDVHLIDVPIDYSDNDRILNNEIRELSSKL
ncbi:MAG: acetolactate synthase large subunit, partial [Calditrichaeota bacterium]|nr:acetolactate synthase large subunit [Calditrichota bacterium]